MENFLNQLGTMSAQVAVIIVVICLVRALLMKGQIPQKYIMLLWVIPFFFMIFPWKISSPVGFWQDSMISQVEMPYEQNVEAYNTQPENTPVQSEVTWQTVQPEASGNETGVSEPIESNPVNQYSMREQGITIIFGVWSIGVLGVLAYLLVSTIRLRKQLACCICEKDNIYVAEDIAVPMVFGVINPRIYLPTGMEGTQKRYVIAHEQTHIMRKDSMKKLLAFLIVGIHWFSPFAWLAFALLERDMEMACDEETVRRLGINDKEAYATTLLWISAGKSRHYYGLGMPLGFGEVDTKQRIKNILINKKAKRLVSVLVILLCVVLTAVFLTKQETSVEVTEEVYAAAENYVKKQYEPVLVEYKEWRITDVTYAYTYEDFYDSKLQVYRFNYEFLAYHPENVVLAGGMTMDEEGWVVPGYPNSMYLIFEEQGEELLFLTTIMENDCVPGDDIFTSDLEHRLLDDGIDIMPAIPIEVTYKGITSDMTLGAEGMSLEYYSEERLVLKDCNALYVYDLKTQEMLRQVDVKAIGCDYTQGDYYCDVLVSEDGSTVYLHPIHMDSMYVYDVEKNTLVKAVYEKAAGLWDGLLRRAEYVGSDFTVSQSACCVEVSSGAYGYLQSNSGYVKDTAWVVRDADGNETVTYLFKEANEEPVENVVSLGEFTMETLLEVLKDANTQEVFQNLGKQSVVYENFTRESSEYSLTWNYFCELSYMNKEYRLQVMYWKPEEAAEYAKVENGLDAIYLIEKNSQDMILLYDAEGRFNATTDITEFLNRNYDIAEYLSLDLPEGTKLSAYQVYNNDVFSGCILQGDYEEIPHGEGLPEAWYAPGGIGVANAKDHQLLVFENGKLSGVEWYMNHFYMDSEGEVLEDCAMQAILYDVAFDTFTAPEWAEYTEKYPDAAEELATSKYWYVFFGEPDGEMIYTIYFNQEFFEKEEVIAIAKTVKFVE